MSVIDLPSKEFLVVSVGKAREKLKSDRVSMNDKNSHKNRGEGSLWKAYGLGSSYQVTGALLGDLVVPLVLCLLYLLYCLCLLCP